MSSSATTGRGGGAPAARVRSLVSTWRAQAESPLTTSYLLLAVVGVLVTVGLVMVLSASMVVSLSESRSVLTIFSRQALYAVVGLVALWWAAGRSLTFWKRVAVPAYLVSAVLLALVLSPLGADAFQGNRNWLQVGPVTVQPSELAKLGLVLGGAWALERKRDRLGAIGHAIVPFVVPGVALVLALVMLGHDLGTAIVICALAVGMLFAAGIARGWFIGGFLAVAGLAALAATVSSNRMQRIRIWLDPDLCAPGSDLYYDICRQPLHGRFALADGGWFGVGLGSSREKWGWLSEPFNDFIFAIIGEELGLLGSLLVLALFAAFALTALRLVTRSEDFFVRVATAGICTWVLVQALINIGSVIGMLPVIGVPLPFVSSGGSSLIASLLAVGVLVSFARHEPGAQELLAARPSAPAAVVRWVRRRRAAGAGS